MTEETKCCRSCKQVKPRSDFHSGGWYTVKSTGERRQTVKPTCRQCHNKATLEEFQRRLDLLGVVMKCVKCGYDKCPEALDFHHKDPAEKDFILASRYTSSLETLRREVAKCVILCANCHREYHAGLFELD